MAATNKYFPRIDTFAHPNDKVNFRLAKEVIAG